MINLLSKNDKRQLRAARTNSLLLRYVILLAGLLLLLIFEMLGAYLVLNESKNASQQQIDDGVSKTASYAETKQKLATFTQDLSTAKYILDLQTPYTEILMRVAASLPEGTSVGRISVDPKTFGTSTTLTVDTDSYDKAIQVKANLQDSGVFSDVNFQSIIENKNQSPRYTATYNVTYSKEADKK